jgi:hypothetical protein
MRSPGKNKQLPSYYLSTIHALIALLGWLHMTFVSCVKPGKTFLTDELCFDSTSAGMELSLTITMAYLAMDSVSGYFLFTYKSWLESFFHHMIGIVGIISMLAIGRVVGVISCCLMVLELSTIFLNNIFILKLNDQTDEYPRYLMFNSVMVVVSFFVLRIVFLWALLF